MGGFPVPAGEVERLKILYELDILDTLGDEAFDRIARLASEILGVPIALISLVDANRQWFKARVGLNATQTMRDLSFCAHAICQDDVFTVVDATEDARFRDNPLVMGEPAIRFYAGAPLRHSSGHNMGTLCVIDRQPRTITDAEKTVLADLAAIVVSQMGMRSLINRAERAEQRLKDAVDAVPDGFVLFDKDDRLVMCNKKYKEMYAQSARWIEPGALFGDILRRGVENGQYPEAAGNEEAWIAERMKNRRAPKEAMEQELPGDRWLRIQERETQDGGLVGFRVDVTELKRQRRELTRLAYTDSLTGLLNRHRFIENGEAEHARSLRHGKQFSIVLIDVDHFKSINDRFGHAAGDAVLKHLADLWRARLRPEDSIGRLGGEEFCLLLPETSAIGAAALAERMRASTNTLPVAFEGQLIPVSISLGVSVCRPRQISLEESLSLADKALYEAKNTGRNRVVMHAAEDRAA